MTERVVMRHQQFPHASVLVDSAHPGLITELGNLGVQAQPVVFQKDLQKMTDAAAAVVARQQVRIHPAFEDLIYQLRAVTFNDKGHHDKTKISFDLGDCFIMAAKQLMVQSNVGITSLGRRR